MKITCHYCGKKVQPITSDHIVPRALYGSNAPWNRVPACLPCNQLKADSWPTCECSKCSYAREKYSRTQPMRYAYFERKRVNA